MSQFLAISAAAVLFGVAPTAALQRDMHDDTIYVVRGAPDQLIRFEKDVGSGWKGGRLLKKEERVHYYWGFPDRTAPQARELMFGAMSSGLNLDIQEYEQSKWFPIARSTLDEIAISCGLQRDPFFITPAGELEIVFDSSGTPKETECAGQKLKAAKLPDISKRPI